MEILFFNVDTDRIFQKRFKNLNLKCCFEIKGFYFPQLIFALMVLLSDQCLIIKLFIISVSCDC